MVSFDAAGAGVGVGAGGRRMLIVITSIISNSIHCVGVEVGVHNEITGIFCRLQRTAEGPGFAEV